VFLEWRVRAANTGVAKQPLLTGCDASVVDLHAEPKGSTPRSRGQACCHLGLGKQVEKGDQKVEPGINSWGLLGRGLKGIDRNRRASTTLSPILYLFQIPTSTLSQKLQHVLSVIVIPPVIETQRRPGPKDIPYGIPEDQWPTVLARVENHESYRKIAADYGVSHETIRRLIRSCQKKGAS
jgi:hypothetical protein